MREELTKVLRARYPALYGPHFGYEHHDGWSGLIGALSEALVAGAEAEGRTPPRASQVKEKFGTLRWYHGFDAYDDGAIDLAEELSGGICERTGRPGTLGSRTGWWATRAPGLDGIEPTAIGFQKTARWACRQSGSPRPRWRFGDPMFSAARWTCRRGGGTSQTGSYAYLGTNRMTGRGFSSTRSLSQMASCGSSTPVAPTRTELSRHPWRWLKGRTRWRRTCSSRSVPHPLPLPGPCGSFAL